MSSNTSSLKYHEFEESASATGREVTVFTGDVIPVQLFDWKKLAGNAMIGALFVATTQTVAIDKDIADLIQEKRNIMTSENVVFARDEVAGKGLATNDLQLPEFKTIGYVRIQIAKISRLEPPSVVF